MKRSPSLEALNSPNGLKPTGDSDDVPLVVVFLGMRMEDNGTTTQGEEHLLAVPSTEKLKPPTDNECRSLSQSVVSSVNSTPLKSLPTAPAPEIEESGPFDRFILDPDGRMLSIWALVRDVCLFYSLITSSFYLAFEYPGPELTIVDIIVWAIFVVDIFVTFLQPFENEDGEVVRSFSKIALNYLQTFFLLDVLAIIPLQFADNAEIEYYFRMVRLLKAKKTLDLIDGHGLGAVIPFFLRLWLGKEFKIGLRHKHKAMILHILLYLSFATYTMGCVWYWYSEKTKALYTTYFLPVTCFHDRYPDATSWELMQRSWYFMITTFATIGYGDIGASNFYETLLLIFLVVVGVSAYSMVIGEFNVIVGELNSLDGSKLSDFHLWLNEIEAIQGKIEPGLKWRIIRAYTLFDSQDRLGSMMPRWWETESIDDMTSPGDSYLSSLPESTLHQIKDYLFEDLFALHVAFFGHSDLKYDLCLSLHPRRYDIGEFILEEGETSHEVLLTTEGRVAVGPMINGTFSQCLVLPEYSILGDLYAFLSKDIFTNFKVVGFKAVFGWAIPNKVFSHVVVEKYRAQAKEIMVKANTKAMFMKKALEVHMRHLKQEMKRVEEVKLGMTPGRPGKEDRISLFESFTSKEEEFVTVT